MIVETIAVDRNVSQKQSAINDFIAAGGSEMGKNPS
jgi:hypothetical protein